LQLLPHVLASVANLTHSDPHSAVQILSFVQELLPNVTSLNNLALQLQTGTSTSPEASEDVKVDTSQPYHAWVESEHPYK
jgi:hypothetical protein